MNQFVQSLKARFHHSGALVRFTVEKLEQEIKVTEIFCRKLRCGLETRRSDGEPVEEMEEERFWWHLTAV